MMLPVSPPLVPMLGRRADALPTGEVVYEPKWDGTSSWTARSS
jgi:ATP-dependent DNA ligase